MFFHFLFYDYALGEYIYHKYMVGLRNIFEVKKHLQNQPHFPQNSFCDLSQIFVLN